jgi:hypothetical protein
MMNTGMFVMFSYVVIEQFFDQDARISTIYYSGTSPLFYDFNDMLNSCGNTPGPDENTY